VWKKNGKKISLDNFTVYFYNINVATSRLLQY